MLTAGFILSILIQLALPLLIGFFIIRRYNTGWRLFVVGALAYLVYMIILTPLFQGIAATDFYTTQIETLPPLLVTLVLGLASAVLEIAARIGSLYYLRRTISQWWQGLTVAAGHAGVESIIMGMQTLINLIAAVSITNSGMEALKLTQEEATQLSSDIASFWALPWYIPLEAALQRLALLALSLVAGMLVWLAFTRKAWGWIAVALIWQAATYVLVGALGQSMPDLGTSAVFAGLLALNGGILYFLYRRLHRPEEIAVP